MASINGISIKNLKHFKDHEGCMIAQGDVWYNGKKLGFWSQDSWGGSDNYDFNEHILDEEVEKYRKSDMVEDKYRSVVDLDSLLYDLLPLIEDEKEWKKVVKKGWKAYVKATDGYHYMCYYSPEIDRKKILKTEFHKDFIKKCEEQFFKNKEIKVAVYTSLNDFKITI